MKRRGEVSWGLGAFSDHALRAVLIVRDQAAAREEAARGITSASRARGILIGENGKTTLASAAFYRRHVPRSENRPATLFVAMNVGENAGIICRR